MVHNRSEKEHSMTIRRILLTGDDGYKAIGTRMLIHALRDHYELTIAGTLTQQSGVGGYISVGEGGGWGEDEVDQVKALWVDGHPVDAMECAQAYFPKPFDLVLSGINLGANVSAAYLTSGTMAAAARALTLGIAPRSIAMSWHAPPELWRRDHDGAEDLAPYLDYPAATAKRLLLLAIKYNFWGTPFLNINFPTEASNQARMTQFLPDVKGYYKYPLIMDRSTMRFAYPNQFAERIDSNPQYDTGAITSGYIAITPCQRDILDRRIYAKYKKKIYYA